ncbi:MAG: hypothetical protein L0Y79_03975 [Chlorobi bacterium]|nr:hypothetical protein [Chlorobiota bacterium]MCI0717275.1 hypothetical protein [Chlorobiota bacterium]
MSILAGEKFELKLIKSDEVLLHEECEDNRYKRLIERFSEEKVLYNPLIVGRYKDKFILIDGANRFEALKQMGCRAILAQLVNYKNSKVRLKSWYHFVNEMTMDELKDYLNKAGLSHKKWSASLRIKKGIAKVNQVVVVSKNGEAISIKLSRDLTGTLKSLCGLNKFYESRFNYMRIDSDTDIRNVDELSPDDGLLFVYPSFTKEHIVKISNLKQKLPAGITRHLIPNRVLHIKLLIDSLITDQNLEHRNNELEKFIKYKIDTKKVRLYKEPILVFDE